MLCKGIQAVRQLILIEQLFIGNMMSDFGYTRDFVVKNAFRDCSKMSQKKLRGCIQILRDTAVMLNSTGADERVALEQAIAKMLVLK